MRRVVLVTLGLAICTACAVGWMWGLYEVTRIGTCASGGPYVSARPCPEGTPIRILTLMGSAFLSLAGLGLYSAGRPKHGRAAGSLGAMMLFFCFAGGAFAMLLSAFGPAAPDGSFRYVAVILSVFFIPMGVLPLLTAIGFDRGRNKLREKALAGVGATAASSPARAGASGESRAERLEKLERLRESGVIDQQEYVRLKAQINSSS